jgi:hypothetical protein
MPRRKVIYVGLPVDGPLWDRSLVIWQSEETNRCCCEMEMRICFNFEGAVTPQGDQHTFILNWVLGGLYQNVPDLQIALLLRYFFIAIIHELLPR